MQSFNIKSIILGIGIGIVLTSIISIIYLAGINPNARMTKQEIIDQAKKYGMVDASELIQNRTASPENKNDDIKHIDDNEIDSTPKPTESHAQQGSPAPQEITILINEGETSEIVGDKLLKSGLVSDKAAFIKNLTDMGLAGKIEVGEFKIKKGTDVNSIIKILTTKR